MLSVNGFLHFNCYGLREVNFRKVSEALKESRSCSNCKAKKTATLHVTNRIVSEETLKSVVESVNFMSWTVLVMSKKADLERKRFKKKMKI